MLTGTHINYYFICHRPPSFCKTKLRRTGKLWLFAHGIGMEHTSDTVLIGKLTEGQEYEG